MRRREIIWIAVLLALGVAYHHFFGARFAPKQMVILAAWHPRFIQGQAEYSMYFTLNDDFKLTSLKVVPVEEDGQINPATRPVWNLISDSNSAPTRAFSYGQHIHGMKPVLADVKPDPLTPGVVYRIVLAAGSVTGSKDFTAKATE
jgi:hypothetical protein